MTLAIFSPVVGFNAVYEDNLDAQLTLDPSRYGVRELAAMPLRSVTKLTRAADMAVFGIQPWGFHLGSLLWHSVNVLLFLALAWLVLPPWGAVAAAGIFAWHPIQVEAVAYVSARADLVSTVGLLLALLATAGRSFAGAVVGVSLAALSKETAIVAWGLVPLWAAWFQTPFPLRRWLGLCLIGMAASLPWLWPYAQTVTLDSVMAGEQLAAIGRLVALVFVPWGLTVDHDWASIAWLGPVAFILSSGVTAWALVAGWRARSWLAFAWLWTLVALLPRLVVPLGEGVHEHHFVVPMVGWALAAGAWLSQSQRVDIWQAEPTI